MMIAAVDLGSNSFRCEIAKTSLGKLVTCRYLKETVRLASGLDENGNLREDAVAKALESLAKFRSMLGNLPADCVAAVGTQAFREAGNADEVLRRCEEALGHPIRLLSGIEEARLVYKGCSHALPPSDETRLVVDIGGASTELILGQGHEPLDMDSLRMGCVSASMAFFSDGVITPERFDLAVERSSEVVRPVETRFARRFDAAYGSAGTFGAIAEVTGAFNWEPDMAVTRADLMRIRAGLIEMGSVENIRFPCLKDDRREVFAGGLATLIAAYDVLGIESMRPAVGALRLGLLYELLEKHLGHTDVEARTTS